MDRVGRWEPDAQRRLQQAAWELFAERGYADVTVAEIADRAGLTKRSFFNHFIDKREVLFAGASDFEDSVVMHVVEANADLDAIDAAVLGLTRAGLGLTGYRAYARARQELIASSTELRERDLIKMASLVSAITEALGRRHISPRTAALAAQAAVTIFNTAYADWITDGTAGLHTLMLRSLADLRQAIGATGPYQG
jgi:AcrR family transcriptional regulator